MLARLSSFALVMLAACEPVPDYSACKLVGSWRCVIPAPDIPGGSGPMIFEELFRANGYTLYGMGNYIPWKLVSDDGHRVVIEYTREIPTFSTRQRTFEFESDDRMHEIEDVARPRTWDRFRGPE